MLPSLFYDTCPPVDIAMKHVFTDPPYHALLLEGINPAAQELLELHGCVVESLPTALSREELLEKIEKVNLLGIRSKTAITKEILDAAPSLLAIGCFCIGTNQVDLDYANKRGVAVFNSPFANTRSVAELVIGEIIALARKMTQRSEEVHKGIWNKTHIGCFEVRGKTLGIVGYGHIGSQVGVLAEALGMKVIFFDIIPTLVMGNATKLSNVDDLLAVSDFVTLHVPETPETIGMIGERELALMKRGAYLLNLSRGKVVDLEALAAAVRAGFLAGAAVDVYPVEPGSANQPHVTPLQGIPNVILTPHVGGSTSEAQTAIGVEVGSAMVQFVSSGASTSAVNFPQLTPPVVTPGTLRVTNVHLNVPGALSDINNVVVNLGCNIGLQFLSTHKAVGYLVMDVEKDVAMKVGEKIAELECSMRSLVIRR